MLYILLLLIPGHCNWTSIISINNPDISQTYKGVQYQETTCPSNGKVYTYLDAFYDQYSFSFTVPSSHFAVKFISDVYFSGEFHNEYFKIYYNGVEVYSKTLDYDSMEYFSEVCDRHMYTKLDGVIFKQIFLESDIGINTIKYETNMANLIDVGGILLGNVEILVYLCYSTCATCSTDAYNACLTCFIGVPINGECSGICPNNGFFKDNLGCVDSCAKTELLSDNNKCVASDKMMLHLDATNFDGWTFIPDDNSVGTAPQKGLKVSDTIDDWLYLKNNEGIQFTIQPQQVTLSVRIIIVFYIQGIWDNKSSIRISWNNLLIYRVYVNADGTVGAIGGYVNSVILNDSGQLVVTTEAYHNYGSWTYPENIEIIGNAKLYSTQIWSLKSVQVQRISCAKYCSSCLTYLKCAFCVFPYKLYDGTCVEVCPNDSQQSGSNCYKYDKNQYVSFYLKAFYNLVNADDATNYIFMIESSNRSMLKGHTFSYLLDKKVFGGALTWFDGKFSKTYTITKPHYRLVVQMELIVGDLFGGTSRFIYKINSEPEVTVTQANYGWSTYVTGCAYEDQIHYIWDNIVTNSDTLTVTVDCKVDQYLQTSESHCLIQNYFILVYECQPLCLACTGTLDYQCTLWASVPHQIPNSTNCEAGYYTDGDTNTCQSCTILAVIYQICTACISPNILQLGRCVCVGNNYLNNSNGIITCVPKQSCTSDCQKCDNLGSTGCTGCDSISKRKVLNQNVCECKPRYFEYYGYCYECDPECLTCTGFYPEDCTNWICQPTCEQCNSIYKGCISCNRQQYLVLNNGECNCIPGYHLVSLTCERCTIESDDQYSGCYSNCGDQIVQWNEECDDGNSILFDGCYQCKFQCESVCSHCVNGKCYHCQIGWLLNQITNICEEVCGDGIQVGNEQCDDGNTNPNDGCYQCQHESCLNCTICENGRCLECNFGWHVINGRCEIICGDLITVFGFEECDDGNHVPYDGCFNCQYECSLECDNCIKGECIKCKNPLKNNVQYQCQGYCGNGIVEFEEECDDGNLVSHDGCYQCRYQCQQSCSSCQFGQCFLCEFGWELVNFICIKCGDGQMISPYKKCDDGNNIVHDGCSNCQIDPNYQCTTQQFIKSYCYRSLPNCLQQSSNGFLCQKCASGYFLHQGSCQICNFKCLTCIHFSTNCIICRYPQLNCKLCSYILGMYKSTKSGQCKSLCGDGVQVKQFEQCDDGNLINGDGCDSKCRIEVGFVCDQVQMLSICNIQIIPKLSLSLSRQINNDQQEIAAAFSSNLTVLVDNGIVVFAIFPILQPDQYFIQIVTSTIPDSQLQRVTQTIDVTLYVTIQTPLLEVYTEMNSLTDSTQQPIPIIQSNIRLKNQFLMSETEQQIYTIAFDFNEAFLYFFIALLVVSVLSGSLDAVWNSLDLLQQLSYIKYINIPLPFVLKQFYEIFDVISIDMMLQYINLPCMEFINFQETNDMFNEYNINASFIQNILSFVVALIFIGSCQVIGKLLVNKMVQLLDKLHFKVGLQFMLLKLLMNLNYTFQQLRQSGFQTLMIQSCYDVSFASTLHIKYGQPASLTDTIQYSIAIATLILQFGYMIYCFQHPPQSTTLLSQIKPQFICQNYYGIQVLKRMLFISLIVLGQDNPVGQAVSIAALSLGFIMYVAICQPLQSKHETNQLYITEVTIMSVALTYPLFLIDQNIIPMIIKWGLAWLNISFLVGSIVAQAILDLHDQLTNFKNNFRQFILQCKKCITILRK